MSYQLRTDEVLEALRRIDHPRAKQHCQAVEIATQAAALDLAQSLGVKCDVASFEGIDFAGTCVPFGPAHEGQELPDALDGYDDRNEWSPV